MRIVRIFACAALTSTAALACVPRQSPEVARPAPVGANPGAGGPTLIAPQVALAVVPEQPRPGPAPSAERPESLPAAVPGDARAALLLDRPWARVAELRKTARKLGAGEIVDETARSLEGAFGFAVDDPKAALEAGLDPERGVALFTVPQDPEALVICLGISDAPRAEATVRRMLARGGRRGGPYALSEPQPASSTRIVVGERGGGSEQVGFLVRPGYLYLRTPGHTDPARSLASSAALQPGRGLDRDEGFRAIRGHLPEGDAIFYSAAPRAPAPGGSTELPGRVALHLGAGGFSLSAGRTELALSLFSQLQDLTGQSLARALTARKPAGDLAAQLPAGAAAWARLGAEPAAAWRELVRVLGADGDRLSERLRELFGGQVEQALLPAFSGNGVVAVYLDAHALLEAVLGELVSALDRSTAIAAIELLPEREAPLRAALDRATSDTGGGRAVGNGTWWPITEALQLAIRSGVLFVAAGGFGGAGEQGRAPASEAGRLLPAGFEVAAGTAAPTTKPRAAGKPPRPKKGKGKTAAKPRPPPTAAELGPLAGVLLGQPGARTLADSMAAASLGPPAGAAQLGYVDLRGVLDQVEAAAEAQGGKVGMIVHVLVQRLRGLRDLAFEVHPEPDGLAAKATLRFAGELARTGAR
jgi:hypothetical protein